jgi:cytochrome P450
MISLVRNQLERWPQHIGNGRPLDIASEMMRLTYKIVASSLLGVDAFADLRTIETEMDVLMQHVWRRLETVVHWPVWVPTPRNRRFRRALGEVDAIVSRIIEQHRQPKDGDRTNGYLLSRLLRVRDEETGEGLSDQLLRNETITFLLAGHETTATNLAWTFYLLSRHPNVERRLREELDTVLGGRTPTVGDLPRLQYTQMVIQESLRLYPPIWIIERRIIDDDVVGPYRLPGGSSIVISPYALHRHPGYWKDPEAFEPERFEARTPKAYMPFGTGPHHCIGNEFAMLEARLILAMVLQSYRLRLQPGHRVEPEPGITLRLRHGLMMTVERAG